MAKTTHKNNFLIFSLFLILGLVGYFLYHTYFRPAPIQVAPINTAGSVTFSLEPAAPSLEVGDTQQFALRANSGTTRLGFVEFKITYDPQEFDVTDVAVGTWLTQEIVTPNHSSAGTITGTLAAHPTASGGAELNRTGTGTLLTFNAKPKKAGTLTIHVVNADSIAYIIGSQDNQLSAANNAIVTAQNPAPVTDLVKDANNIIDGKDYVAFMTQYVAYQQNGTLGTANFVDDNVMDGKDYVFFIADWGKTW